ncbi:hypothetical protein BDFG_09327, partial [Blastomyces dermatitidis ATCC 26199]
SSCVNRSVSADDSELNIKSLIENLKNMIIKKLSVLCMTESFIFSSVSSVTASQSSTSVSVSDSPASAISVSMTLTSTTSCFSVSAFIISSLHFKKMLHRLNESCFSRIISSLNSIKIIMQMKDICVFKNENINIILFYTHRCETFTSVSEIILIEDNNITETTLFHFQASSITFSFFSAEKIVYTLS